MNRTRIFNSFRIGSAIILCSMFAFIAIWSVNLKSETSTDFFQFWLAGYFMRQGVNPYDIPTWLEAHELFQADWVGDQTYLYPVQFSLFFAPLSLLDIKVSYIIWVFISMIFLVVSVLLILDMSRGEGLGHYILPIVIGLAAFRPILMMLHFGQVTALFLVIAVLAAFVYQKDQFFFGSLLISILILKPVFGLPVIVIVSLWLVIEKNTRGIYGLIVGCLAITLSGFMINSNWVFEFLEIGSRRGDLTFGYSTSAFGISAALCNQARMCSYALGVGITGVLLLMIALIIWQNRGRLSAVFIVSLALLFGILASVYMWPYDLSLLVMPITLIIGRMAGRIRFVFLALLPVAISLLVIPLTLATMNSLTEAWSAILVILIMVLQLWSHKSDIRLRHSQRYHQA
jgi:hypothetical protein